MAKKKLRKNPKQKKKTSRKKRRRVGRPLGLFLLILVAAAVVWAGWPLKYKIEQRNEIDELRNRVDILRQENKELKNDVSKLGSSAYIEQLARKDLGLVKPGEEAYLVVEDGSKSEEEEPVKKPEKEKETVWGKISNFLARLPW